jgi:hypothetical protein
MAARDAVGTFLTVAEARGRGRLAGMLDALGDLAGIAVTVVGAGSVIRDGVTGHTVGVVGSMLVVSMFGTWLWTSLAWKWLPPDRSSIALARLSGRVSALERAGRVRRG